MIRFLIIMTSILMVLGFGCTEVVFVKFIPVEFVDGVEVVVEEVEGGIYVGSSVNPDLSQLNRILITKKNDVFSVPVCFNGQEKKYYFRFEKKGYKVKEERLSCLQARKFHEENRSFFWFQRDIIPIKFFMEKVTK
jgi:hypothetical protein